MKIFAKIVGALWVIGSVITAFRTPGWFGMPIGDEIATGLGGGLSYAILLGIPIALGRIFFDRDARRKKDKAAALATDATGLPK